MGDRHRVIECKIVGADISDHNALFLKLNRNARKRQTIWILNVGVLNNEGLVKDLKEDIRQYMVENNNGEVDLHIIWDALKVCGLKFWKSTRSRMKLKY